MSRLIATGEEFEVRVTDDLIECRAPRYIREPAEARLLAASLVAAAAYLEATSAPTPTAPVPQEPGPRREPNPLDHRYWFSTGQAAEYLGMSSTTVVKACQSGELTASQRVFGGRWRIHRDDLNAWVEGKTR